MNNDIGRVVICCPRSALIIQQVSTLVWVWPFNFLLFHTLFCILKYQIDTHSSTKNAKIDNPMDNEWTMCGEKQISFKILSLYCFWFLRSEQLNSQQHNILILFCFSEYLSHFQQVTTHIYILLIPFDI